MAIEKNICSKSLPTWERGLKLRYRSEAVRIDVSLPTWERGLKLCYPKAGLLGDNVAPYVGAWIETFKK